MPAKTLLGSPTDDDAISGRKQQLRGIIHDLLTRPDTRTSHQLRMFLAMDGHVERGIRSLQPEAVRTFEDPRFGVSGLCLAPRCNMMLVTHEDSTHLSRLGRVWSVVEPDELGALHIWVQTSEGGWKRMYSNTFGQKVRSLTWEETTRQFFVGLEDGKIDVYSISHDTLQPTRKASLDLHHKSPVTYLSASSRRLLSLGFDTAMRVIDVNSRELVCGGRLIKRLKSETDYLSCGYLDDARDRAFIGTSGGDIFILDITKNPPNFLHNLEMSSKPVSMFCVALDKLLVAHGDCVSVLSFEEKGLERRMSRQGSHSSKHLSFEDLTILSVTAAPERGLIFGGYSDGSVAIWTTRETEAFIVLRAHSDNVTALCWLEGAPWGPALFSGGGDGKVTTWRMPQDDLVFWTPREAIDKDSSDSSRTPLRTTALRDENGLSPEAQTVGASQARVDPRALKGGDSDSDNDDIVDAFR